MNRKMLEEAIAEAKTIRETAIESAKIALEEAFTPQLTAMFAERLNELELEEKEEKDETNEMYGMEEEGLEETFSLEELLAELDKAEKEAETNEAKDMENEGQEKLDEDLMLEEMSDDEIEELVKSVIDDMIASGKLMAGEEAEDEDMEDMEDMGGEEEIEAEEEIDIDEILAEVDSEEAVNEGIVEIAKIAQEMFRILADGGDPVIYLQQVTGKDPNVLAALGSAIGAGGLIAKVFAPSIVDRIKKFIASKTGKKVEETTEAASKEMEETIAELRNKLNEVNLLNAKLLYTNKIFKAKNLTESEKIKVLNTFDKAETVKEVKLIFETLTESFKAPAKKNSIKESLGSSSKTIAPSAPKQPIIEANDAFARMQKLAGLKK